MHAQNLLQALPVSRALRFDHEEILVHSGQHYDYLMSQKFFDELDIPSPDYNLKVGSGSHNQQVAKILIEMEKVIIKEAPDLMMARGDTNTTLASTLFSLQGKCARLCIIEAGERSFRSNDVRRRSDRVTVDCSVWRVCICSRVRPLLATWFFQGVGQEVGTLGWRCANV